jgi:hypothetical protein
MKGMQDWFRPNPVQKCPFCGRELRGWQGKDGPGLSLVWEQHNKVPVGQNVPDDEKLHKDELNRQKLPDSFVIFTQNCQCDRIIYAECRCVDGVWVSIELLA